MHAKKITSLNSREKESKIIAIDELRQEYKLAILLEVSNISKSTFYFGLNKLKREDKYKELKELICEIFIENKGRYGYRRITL